MCSGMIMDITIEGFIPKHKLADPVTGEAANDNQILHLRPECTRVSGEYQNLP